MKVSVTDGPVILSEINDKLSPMERTISGVICIHMKASLSFSKRVRTYCNSHRIILLIKCDGSFLLLRGLRTNQRYLFLILNDCIQVCYDESPFVYSGPGMRAHGPWYAGL